MGINGGLEFESWNVYKCVGNSTIILGYKLKFEQCQARPIFDGDHSPLRSKQ